METDSTRMCALVVGLPDVTVSGVGEWPGWLMIAISTNRRRPSCARCGTSPRDHGQREVTLVDLPAFGRPTRLVWSKQRWLCANRLCAMLTWTEQDSRIGTAKCALTTRAARWATLQVGRHGRAVSEIAADLGCDWHTVMDAVVVFGTPLIDDPAWFGAVTAVGLDETLYVCEGVYRKQVWSTQVVDVQRGQLLDVLAGKDVATCCAWFAARPAGWCDQVRWATLDLSSLYRTVFDTMLPDAVQVADPFHVIQLANQALDECRRRVQNETLGHRGHKDDPLYRCRRRLVMASERLSVDGRERLMGLLAAGDPARQVWFAWNAGKRSCVKSTTTPTPPSPRLGWPRSCGTSPTNRCPSRSAGSAAQSSVGDRRSLLGTPHTYRTGRPKQSLSGAGSRLSSMWLARVLAPVETRSL